MKKTLLLALTIIITISGLYATTKAKKAKQTSPIVEVLYFHGKQRCATCIAVGNYAKEVVDQEFTNQKKAGLVKFKEIDISTPEGEKIADRYKVTWSALYVNQWKNGKEQRTDLTSFAFENAREDTPAYKKRIRELITSLLK